MPYLRGYDLAGCQITCRPTSKTLTSWVLSKETALGLSKKTGVTAAQARPIHLNKGFKNGAAVKQRLNGPSVLLNA